MTPAGRPEIGNPIHVRVGDLLTDIDAFRIDHGYRKRQRPDAVRDLIRRGLEASGGERILCDNEIPSRYDPLDIEDAGVLKQYLAAIGGGTTLRKSETPGDTINRIRLVQYVDPIDGSTRHAVHFADSYDQLTDYTDRKIAESAYEAEVRSLAESDWMFAVTDVEGVPTRATNPEPSDF